MSDIIFICFDVAFIALVLVFVKTSQKVKIENDSKNALLFTVMFLVVGVMSYFQYEGILKYVQPIALCLGGILYYFVKSGIAEEGIVMSGMLKTWSEIGKVTMNLADNSISFQWKKRTIKLFFKKEQMKLVREMLENNHKKK